MISGLASLGLPGLSGFVSEIIIFMGTFKIFPIYTIISAFGVVLAAGYILWMIQRSLFGKNKLLNKDQPYKYEELSDGTLLDLLPAFILTIPIFLIGIWPRFFLSLFDLGIKEIIK